MKPVFAIDSTNGYKNSVYNADKFVTAEISEASSDRLFDAQSRLDDKKNEVRGPFLLKHADKIFLSIGLILMMLTYYLIQKFERYTTVLAALGIAIIIGSYIASIISKKKLKALNANANAVRTDDDIMLEKELDAAVRCILDEFSFPCDAKTVDLLDINYKEKDGVLKDISKCSCSLLPTKIYKKGSTLYITDLEQKYEFPLNDGAYIEEAYAKLDPTCPFFEIERRNLLDSKYAIDGVNITLDMNGEMSSLEISSYGILKFTLDGEEYGIYVANYDIPILREIING